MRVSAEAFGRLMNDPPQFKTPYEAGVHCGINGPDNDNCHYSWFSSSARTAEWERGKAAAQMGEGFAFFRWHSICWPDADHFCEYIRGGICRFMWEAGDR